MITLSASWAGAAGLDLPLDTAGARGCFPSGAAWAVAAGRWFTRDTDRPLFADGPRVHLLDARADRDGLAVLLRVRVDDPDGAALFAEDWRLVWATLRAGVWDTWESPPLALPLSTRARLDPGGGAVSLVFDPSIGAEVLVAWRPGETARALLRTERSEVLEGWDAAGERVVAWGRDPATGEGVAIRRDEDGAVLRWRWADDQLAGALRPDGAAWIVADGALWSWDVGAPRLVPVEVLLPEGVTRPDSGRIVGVWSGPTGDAVVTHAYSDHLEWLDPSGRIVGRAGRAPLLSCPEQALTGAGPVVWGTPGRPPRWSRTVPPLALRLPATAAAGGGGGEVVAPDRAPAPDPPVATPERPRRAAGDPTALLGQWTAERSSGLAGAREPSTWTVRADGRRVSVKRDGQPVSVIGWAGASLLLDPPGPGEPWRLTVLDAEHAMLGIGAGDHDVRLVRR